MLRRAGHQRATTGLASPSRAAASRARPHGRGEPGIRESRRSRSRPRVEVRPSPRRDGRVRVARLATEGTRPSMGFRRSRRVRLRRVNPRPARRQRCPIARRVSRRVSGDSLQRRGGETRHRGIGVSEPRRGHDLLCAPRGRCPPAVAAAASGPARAPPCLWARLHLFARRVDRGSCRPSCRGLVRVGPRPFRSHRPLPRRARTLRGKRRDFPDPIRGRERQRLLRRDLRCATSVRDGPERAHRGSDHGAERGAAALAQERGNPSFVSPLREFEASLGRRSTHRPAPRCPARRDGHDRCDPSRAREPRRVPADVGSRSRGHHLVLGTGREAGRGPAGRGSRLDERPPRFRGRGLEGDPRHPRVASIAGGTLAARRAHVVGESLLRRGS